MSEPSVAVVVPTYNRAAHIGAALDSILAQTDPADEIIVVDDGSTDDTGAALARYGDAIRVVHQQNAGAAAARNTGAASAASDWLAFLDSDDLWRPGRLALLRGDLAGAGEDVVAHVANVLFKGVGAERDFFSAIRVTVPPGEVRAVARPLEMFLHSFFLVGVAVRRDAFTALGGFDTSFPTDEDTELAHRMAARGGFLVRGDILAEVIRQPGDTGALSALRARDPFLANDLKQRHFRGILARSGDARDRALAGAALSSALLERAALLRKSGQGGYLGMLAAAARCHPVAWKGYAKALRAALAGGGRRPVVDRTGGG